MSILTANQLSKKYGNHLVLDQVSLDLEQGEILTIVGRSGSGKSTLLKIIGGHVQPDGGQVHFQGKKLKGPEDQLVPGHEEIKLVFQEFKLHHKLTVRENIRHALLDYVSEYQESRTEELIELCGLSSVAHKDVSLISGGEKQRVSIARAFASSPYLVLMDEPFSNLDVVTKSQLIQETRELAKKLETTIVLVTHDPRDALEIADRILVLQEGKLLIGDTPERLYDSPQYLEVAQLFGIFTLFDREEIVSLIPDFNIPGEQFGIWAENIRIAQSEGIAGIVKRVAFMGAFHLIQIDLPNKQGIQVMDPAKKLKEHDSVRLILRESAIFPLKLR